MAETMTLDEATEVVWADEAPAENEIAPLAPEPDVLDEGTLEDQPEGTSEERSLTVDEAAALDIVDNGGSAADDADAGSESEKPIAVLDGTPLTRTQLVQGYAHGMQLQAQVNAISGQTREVEVAAERVAGAAWTLAGLIQRQMPPLPDPALARLNPAEYVRREAIYNEASATVEALLSQGEEARQASGLLAGQQRTATIQRELHQLAFHFPSCVKPEGREAFLSRVWEAVSSCGFTEAEMRQVIDHRHFRLAALAALGLDALQRSQQPKRSKSKPRREHSSAMARLRESGSLEDAVAVDWA
jgi:hypothetical protein